MVERRITPPEDLVAVRSAKIRTSNVNGVSDSTALGSFLIQREPRHVEWLPAWGSLCHDKRRVKGPRLSLGNGEIVKCNDTGDRPGSCEHDSISETLVAIDIPSQRDSKEGCQNGPWGTKKIGTNTRKPERFDDGCAPRADSVHRLETG